MYRTPQHLMLGDEWKDSRDWKGSVRRVALLGRFLDEQEAARRYAGLRGEAEEPKTR